MRYGITIFPTEYTVPPDELARLVEERGFDSIWFPEHTHIPASRRSPWPGGPELPKEYWHTYDPFVALTAAAAATHELKVATGVCLIVERDPIVTAKAVATLDRLSDGRFIFGIGGGWNAEEMENHGTKFASRFRLLNERMRAMRKLWTEDEPEFHGKLVDFDKVWSNPKPVQQPHPPIFMGGDGPTTWDRVIEFCDGWLPISRQGVLPANLKRIPELKAKAGAAGRDPDSISVTLFSTPPNREAVDEAASYGVDRVIFSLPCRAPTEVLPVLDEYSKLVE